MTQFSSICLALILALSLSGCLADEPTSDSAVNGTGQDPHPVEFYYEPVTIAEGNFIITPATPFALAVDIPDDAVLVKIELIMPSVGTPIPLHANLTGCGGDDVAPSGNVQVANSARVILDLCDEPGIGEQTLELHATVLVAQGSYKLYAKAPA